MDFEHLTADECEEFADAFAHDAASCASVEKRAKLAKLAQAYRNLAAMKRMVAAKVS